MKESLKANITCKNTSGAVLQAYSPCVVISISSSGRYNVTKATEDDQRHIIITPPNGVAIGADFVGINPIDAYVISSGTIVIGDVLSIDVATQKLIKSVNADGPFVCCGKTGDLLRIRTNPSSLAGPLQRVPLRADVVIPPFDIDVNNPTSNWIIGSYFQFSWAYQQYWSDWVTLPVPEGKRLAMKHSAIWPETPWKVYTIPVGRFGCTVDGEWVVNGTDMPAFYSKQMQLSSTVPAAPWVSYYFNMETEHTYDGVTFDYFTGSRKTLGITPQTYGCVNNSNGFGAGNEIIRNTSKQTNNIGLEYVEWGTDPLSDHLPQSGWCTRVRYGMYLDASPYSLNIPDGTTVKDVFSGIECIGAYIGFPQHTYYLIDVVD